MFSDSPPRFRSPWDNVAHGVDKPRETATHDQQLATSPTHCSPTSSTSHVAPNLGSYFESSDARRVSTATAYRSLEHDFEWEETADLPPEFQTQPAPARQRKPGQVIVSYIGGVIKRFGGMLFKKPDAQSEDAGRSSRRLSLPLYLPKRPSLPVLPNLPAPFANVVPFSGIEMPNVLKDRLAPVFARKQRPEITRNVNAPSKRRKFVLKLAKAFLTFGAPSHRIQSQLSAACKILQVNAQLAYLPNIILVSFTDEETRTAELHLVRSGGGRIALTSLQSVHHVYREVVHDRLSVVAGTTELDKILRSPPEYPLYMRCFLSFVSASVICPLAFDGSFVDMWVSGICASVLQYLGLQMASKSSVYANVYEISAAIIVSFVARALASIPGRIFCYSAISSAGVVLILPGYTILVSALELTSRNILCGSVRLVYAVIYAFFLGFGITIGSDLYLLINPRSQRKLSSLNSPPLDYMHGVFSGTNGSDAFGFNGTFAASNVSVTLQAQQACYRGPDWPWYLTPFQFWPWWKLLVLVPLYATCTSLSNLQAIRSWKLLVMVFYACIAYIANYFGHHHLNNTFILSSASGALAIGLLGNFQSRFFGGTAFTTMVTGVLFLVPSGLSQGGSIASDSSSRYNDSFTLGLRMINIAIGVTIGLFVSQTIVYAFSRQKKAGHMAF